MFIEMTPWLLLSIILGFSQALSDKSLIFTPNVFRCNETEIILVHSDDPLGTCMQLQLRREIDGKVINETKKELVIETKKLFQIGVFNEHCLNDHVYLYMTTYQAENEFIEITNSDECLDVVIGNKTEFKIPVQRDIGYIFIQTDLPIYHPSETVQIRIFRLNENMYPVNPAIEMVIKEPSNSVVKSEIFNEETHIISSRFQLDNNSPIGVWTIAVKYLGNKMLKETNIRFLVQHYVMPKFEIHIDVQPKIIPKEINSVNITISAMYLYNKTVDGNVYLQYGKNMDRISGKLENGQYFQQVKIEGDRCGAFFISAKVIETNTRMTEYKTDSSANFKSDSVAKGGNNLHGNKRHKFLRKVHYKEYYSRGDHIQVVAKNCWKIHYCIIGRGRILEYGRAVKHENQDTVMIRFNLKEDMIPVAKLIAYCIHKKKMKYKDSLSFKVLDICSQKKQLEFNIEPQKEVYSPQDNITIQIKGSQGQTIGLTLVDDAVHIISNRYRLTTDFVRKKMLSHHLKSFVNLENINRNQFTDTGYNIHEEGSLQKGGHFDNITEQFELYNYEEVSRYYQPRRARLMSDPGPKTFTYNNFPASKLYKTYSLSNGNTLNVNLILPDSLTRWHIQVISLSRNHPFCVYEPPPIITFKYIVPRLHIPQDVKKYGMFEIKFILYNYGRNSVKVNITLQKTRFICSEDNKMDVTVPASGSTVTKFLAYAMHIGNVPVSVSIDYYHDAEGKRKEIIERTIAVQDHLVSKPKILTFFSEKNNDFEDSEVSGMTCNERSVLGDIVKTTLQEPEKILQKTHGSGNQNIIYMAIPVYVLKYILNTKQMNRELYNNGTKFIRMGIEKQKFFQKNDGSYSTYADTKSSIWLTAFVLKIFCQASEFEEIDEEITQQAMFWLLQQQDMKGRFEDAPYINRDIMGGRSTLELTAFVLISLMECRQIHAREINMNKDRIILSMNYLENNLHSITDELTLAITTYALTLTLSGQRISARDKMITMVQPWQEQNSLEKPSSESVLIASYYLLTELQYDDSTMSFPINWLIQQKDKNGMFSSAQNTVIALQALAEYAIKWNTPDLDLKILQPPENSQPEMTINKKSFFKKTNTSQGSTERQIKVNSIGVHSTYVQVLTDFNIFNANQKNCHFNISYKMGKNNAGKDVPHFLNITFRYNGKSKIEAPVMEVDLIPGFYMNNDVFREMQSLNIIKEIVKNGESALTFFLQMLEPGDQHTLSLILQRGDGIKMPPSSIKIYDNDKPDENCVILYPESRYFPLFCHSKQCLCPQGCLTKKPLNKDDMINYYCKPNQTGIIVKILDRKKQNFSAEENQFKIIYSAEIKKVLSKTSGSKRKVDIIINYKCPNLKLKKNTKYLIVTDKYIQRDTNRDIIWIDDYGFIHSFDEKKKELNDFLNKITDLEELTCSSWYKKH